MALEPRGWDAGGAYDKHKRPDIEWINAKTRLFTITDITIDWTMTAGDGTEHAASEISGPSSKPEERARRPPGEFAPLGFAKNGAWGPEAQRVFADLASMVERKRASADLWGWSAMSRRAGSAAAGAHVDISPDHRHASLSQVS